MSTKKKIKYPLILFLSILLFSVNSTRAQEWPKIYGDSFHSLVNDLNQIYDNGYILSAFTYAPYGFCKFIWIIKIDINGNILWDKKFGDENNQFWLSNSETSIDNGFIISGATTKYSLGDFDPLFIKTDYCGEIEWCQVLQSPDQNYGTDILQLVDESYIGLLTYYGDGPEYSRISLIKMNQIGEPIWIQQLAQEDTLIYNEEGGYLYLTKDQNYLVSGECFHPGLKPYWIKTDTSGNQIWNLMWQGGVGGAYQVVESDNEFFYSAGGFAGPGYSMTPSIFKFDNDGAAIYQKYLLGDTLIGGGANPIILLNDSVLLTGIQWRVSPNVDDGYSEILMTDTLGIIINRRIMLHENRPPSSIILSHDNKILVTGSYVVDGNWDIYLWKMNSDLEDDSLYTQPITYDSLCPYQILSDTVDLDCSLFVNIDEIPTKEEYESTIKFRPNPARDWIALTLPDNFSSGVVDLAIYNIFGQEVMKSKVILQNRMTSLNISNLPAGFYLAVCKDAKNRILKGKFIVGR